MKITKNKLTRIYKYISLCPEQSEQSSVDIQIDPFFSNRKNGDAFFIVNHIDSSKVSPETLEFLFDESRCAFCSLSSKSDFSFSACGCNKTIKKGFYKIKSEKIIRLYSLLENEEKKDKYRLRHKSQRKIKKMAEREVFRKLWDFQKGKCFYCEDILGSVYDRRYFQVDHFKPLSKGGSNQLINLRLSCGDCNRSKNNVPLNVFWTRLKNKKILPFRAITMFSKWIYQNKYANQPIIRYEDKLHDFWMENFGSPYISSVKFWLKEMFAIIPNKNSKTYSEALLIFKEDRTYLKPKIILFWIEKRKKWVIQTNKQLVTSFKNKNSLMFSEEI